MIVFTTLRFGTVCDKKQCFFLPIKMIFIARDSIWRYIFSQFQIEIWLRKAINHNINIYIHIRRVRITIGHSLISIKNLKNLKILQCIYVYLKISISSSGIKWKKRSGVIAFEKSRCIQYNMLNVQPCNDMHWPPSNRPEPQRY